MAQLIKLHKLSDWPVPNFDPDYLFSDFVETILGQQLSNKAADTIIGRYKKLFGGRHPTPKELLTVSDEKIRACGTSWAKIKYLKNIATAILDNTLDLALLPTLPDDQVRQTLLKIKGIGPWTVEMILMFTLRREDIFSPGDAGLQNALVKFYGVKRGDLKTMLEISDKWRPYRTLACRYLWRALDNK